MISYYAYNRQYFVQAFELFSTIMRFEYYVLVLILQLAAAAQTLSIALDHGTFTLQEDYDATGSSWQGIIPWSDRTAGRSRSVKDCQDLAGKIARAVVAAVKADEDRKVPSKALTTDDRALRRSFGRTGNLLFSVYAHTASKFAYVGSVARSDAARKTVWERIPSEAPMLNSAILVLDDRSPDEKAQLHGEEVAYFKFESSEMAKQNQKTLFGPLKDQPSKRPADSTPRGYPEGPVVGSWKIIGREYKKGGQGTLGDKRAACTPEGFPGLNINKDKERTACSVISSELGVRTDANGHAPVAGSESTKLGSGGAPEPKRQRPDDDCNEDSSTGIGPRANACLLSLKSGTKGGSGQPPASNKQSATATIQQTHSSKLTTSRGSVFAKITIKNEQSRADHQTTMKTMITKPNTRAAAAATTTTKTVRPTTLKKAPTIVTQSKHNNGKNL